MVCVYRDLSILGHSDKVPYTVLLRSAGTSGKYEENRQIRFYLENGHDETLDDLLKDHESEVILNISSRSPSISSRTFQRPPVSEPPRYSGQTTSGTWMDEEPREHFEIRPTYSEIGRAVQQECRDRSRMPSSA
eukprot:TRINITY_DN29407_c0_g2_i2.p1 TRINITY_DN29407_c0_g2~~TRINITY_DN29407_c0_g2_i2.p1  ORF type:complete len:134 (+),score=8.22 TRINITY_DN29407_c0_g2_i2:111-512(+)